ncbi:MAG: hypothetical protein IK084_04575, partial [Bacteroidaceae bacterium]|nr:hypothetical protein [Bacteroidaceae bacterium]
MKKAKFFAVVMRTKLWFLMVAMLFASLTGVRADVTRNWFVNDVPAAWGGSGGVTPTGEPYLVERYFGDRPTGPIMAQAVSALPNGTYDVVVYAHACHANGVGGDFVASTNTLSVNGSSQTVTTIDNSAVDDLPMNEYTFENVAVTDGTMEIRFSATEAGANWFTIRVKSVTLKGSFENYALTNGDFSAQTGNGQTITGWTSVVGFKSHINDAKFTGTFAEMWSGDGVAMAAGSLNKDVTLPAGIY